MVMATPTAAQKLGQAESIAKALGVSQPELAVPCLDLVTVFEELKATDDEAGGLWEDLRSLQTQSESIEKPPVDALNNLIRQITLIFERLAAHRIRRSMWDAVSLRLHHNTRWTNERLEILDTAHVELQHVVAEYERSIKEHTARVERALTIDSRESGPSHLPPDKAAPQPAL